MYLTCFIIAAIVYYNVEQKMTIEETPIDLAKTKIEVSIGNSIAIRYGINKIYFKC